jgi:hypothetical protein
LPRFALRGGPFVFSCLFAEHAAMPVDVAKDFGASLTSPSRAKSIPMGKTYAKIGQNSIMEASPAVVHFGGYSIHKRHQQLLRVINISSVSQRIDVLNPMTPYFRIRYNKKGLIAPGMSEDITIEFEPNEWRYYYDCIRLHLNDSQNLLVPIHAYPVMNEVTFPSRLDLGACPLAETMTRVLKLECNVPIQFEYKIDILEEHSDLTISPLSGIVPANGHTEITVSFRPVTLAVCSMKVRLDVSQFNFKPIECTIVGSSEAGLVRKIQLAKTSMPGSVKLGISPGPESVSNGFVPPRPPQLNGTKVKPLKAKADPGGELVEKVRRERYLKGKAKKQQDRPRTPEADIEGLKVPRAKDINSVTSLNFVLTQKKGKLKPRDLKAAIDSQRQIKQQQKAEQEAIRKQTQGGDQNQSHGPGRMALSLQTILAEDDDRKPISRSFKEMMFMQDLSELEEGEKAREFQSQLEFVGEDVLSPEAVELIVQMREHHKCRRDRSRRETQRTTFTNIAEGPQQNPPVRMSIRAHHLACPSKEPTFDSFKNDEWRQRKMILSRLKRLCNRFIVRQRADKRLAKLKEALKGCQSRADVKQMVELDSQGVQPTQQIEELPSAAEVEQRHFEALLDDNDDADGVTFSMAAMQAAAGLVSENFNITVERVQRVTFPLFSNSSSNSSGSSSSARAPVKTNTPRSFNNFSPMKAKAACEFEAVGHVVVPPQPIPTYMPRPFDEGRCLRTGATEEKGVRNSRAVMPVPAPSAPPALVELAGGDEGAAQQAVEELHDIDCQLAEDVARKAAPKCLVAPRDRQGVAVRASKEDFVFLQEPLLSVETDISHVLRSSEPMEDWCPPDSNEYIESQSAGTIGMHYLKSLPTLSQIWRPRYEPRISFVNGEVGHKDLWTPLGLPKLTAGHIDDDDMSDSESDFEIPNAEEKPTVELARTIFLAPTGMQHAICVGRRAKKSMFEMFCLLHGRLFLAFFELMREILANAVLKILYLSSSFRSLLPLPSHSVVGLSMLGTASFLFVTSNSDPDLSILSETDNGIFPLSLLRPAFPRPYVPALFSANVGTYLPTSPLFTHTFAHVGFFLCAK